ncbi:MAG: hypothetical protein [Bacteriophage sp.]|nr:MAG: hypothetical protein [Bacteriophage sp.]
MTNIVMTDEIWKDIEGYDGRYMVSNYGRVKNCQRNKLMSCSVKSATGYREVCLQHPIFGQKNLLVHRLVAFAFIPNPDNLPCVNHIDEVRSNSHSINLEWCTYQYNNEYSQSKVVMFISPLDEVVEVKCLRRFCRENNLDQSAMRLVLLGKRVQHKGWRSCNA